MQKKCVSYWIKRNYEGKQTTSQMHLISWSSATVNTYKKTHVFSFSGMEHLGVWCQGGKTSRMILGEIVASWQSGKGLRPSANNLKPIILHWERFISGKCNFSFQVYLYISSLPQHLSWGILHCEVKMLQYKRKTSKRKNSTLTGRNLQQDNSKLSSFQTTRTSELLQL